MRIARPDDSKEARGATNDARHAGLAVRFGVLVIDLLLFCVVFFPVTRIAKGV